MRGLRRLPFGIDIDNHRTASGAQHHLTDRSIDPARNCKTLPRQSNEQRKRKGQNSGQSGFHSA